MRWSGAATRRGARWGLAVALAITATAWAGADTGRAATLVSHARVVSGPELAGSRLALLTDRPGRRFALTLTGAGLPAVTVAHGRFTPASTHGSNSESDTITFAASPTRVVMRRDKQASDGTTYASDDFALSTVGVDGLGGLPIYACTISNAGSENDFALAGDTVAYVDACTSHDVVVRNLATGAQRSFAPPGEQLFQTAALSDRYLAVSWVGLEAGGNRIDLYDRATGAKVLEVAPPAPAYGIAVDDAGVVWTTSAHGNDIDGTCADLRPAWYSVAAPTAHVIGRRACGNILRPVGGRVLFLGTATGGTALLTAGTGGDVATVAPVGRVAVGDFDTDGAQVVYGLRECSGRTTVLSAPLAGPAQAAGSPACPARFAGRHLVLRGRRTTLRLRCPKGCQGSVELRVHKRRRPLAGTGFTFRPGPRAHRLRLPLTRRAARRVHRLGRLHVQLLLSVYDRGGRVRPVHRRVTLRG